MRHTNDPSPKGGPRPKILIVSNTGWNLYNFRLPLARALRDRGADVVFVSPTDRYVERLKEEGFRCIQLPVDRAGVNPIHDLYTLAALTSIYLVEKPAAVHHITVKCVLYGTIAAAFTRVRAVVNVVSGLGHVFIGNDWKARVARPIVTAFYRLALRSPRVRVIFQNAEDLAVFRSLGLVRTERVALIRGSGVNLNRFQPRRQAETSGAEPPCVLVVARLLAEKGLVEFVQAAHLLRSRGVQATFQVAGDLDEGNPSSISSEQLSAWRSEGLVDFKGHVDDVERLLGAATIVVLPSYREGISRTLLEAAAMAKPIVTTNVPGCRDVVEHNRTGLLVPPKDPAALAGAIESLLAHAEQARRMGEAGRQKIAAEFDERAIAAATLRVYMDMGVLPGRLEESHA